MLFSVSSPIFPTCPVFPSFSGWCLFFIFSFFFLLLPSLLFITADTEHSCGYQKVSKCGPIKCTCKHQPPKHHDTVAWTRTCTHAHTPKTRPLVTHRETKRHMYTHWHPLSSAIVEGSSYTSFLNILSKLEKSSSIQQNWKHCYTWCTPKFIPLIKVYPILFYK